MFFPEVRALLVLKNTSKQTLSIKFYLETAKKSPIDHIAEWSATTKEVI